MNTYDHKDIEPKWQQAWQDANIYTTPDSMPGKENYYTLVEFPYPSGNLHVGHWYAFAVTDMYARYYRMLGYNVLFPFGFDAFGLPAENAAIKNKVNPREWTYSNMEHMRTQVQSMGAMIDWSREVMTCDPQYYKWTQWLFLQMYKANLAEQKETPANWCPSCKTVLANEQVNDGACDRCGTPIEQKNMKQWSIKITQYADRLIDDLEALDWPEEIKTAQRNWIGRSYGAEIQFTLTDPDQTKVAVFTTRPDTLFGATYLVIAPEHDLVQSLQKTITNWPDVEAYIAHTEKKSSIDRMSEQKEKTGVILKGVSAINPATKKEIPVFIADYVLANYGTGCVMAVPAHDERDYEFATKFDLPMIETVRPVFIDHTNSPVEGKKTVERNNVIAIVENKETNEVLTLHWKIRDKATFVIGGVDDGEDVVEAAKREISEETGYQHVEYVSSLGFPMESHYYAVHKDENRIAHTTVLLFKLTSDMQNPVSNEELDKHSVHWKKWKDVKPENFACAELPTILERLEKKTMIHTGVGRIINSGEFDGMDSVDAKEAITKYVGGNMVTNYKLRNWGVSRQRYWGCPIPIIHCSSCGPVAVPDDQLPVELPDVDDYLPRDDGKSPLAKATDWVNTTCPSCGASAERETDTFDTFIDSSWYFLRYTDPTNQDQFAAPEKLEQWMPVDFYSGGAEHTTMHLLYSRFFQKALFDLGLVKNNEPYTKRLNRGLILGPDGNKMSKSKGNVIDPDEIVERLGADTVRLYLAFIGPYNEVGSYPWDPNGVVGVRRFLERVWKLGTSALGDSESEDATRILHKTIKKVSEDCAKLKFNTAISAMMMYMNAVEKYPPSIGSFKQFIQLLAPFAPHISEELWHATGETNSIHISTFPTYDESMLVESTITYAVQINGKVRATFEAPVDAEKTTLEQQAQEVAQKWIDGTEIKKIIVVPGKLINIVVS